MYMGELEESSHSTLNCVLVTQSVGATPPCTDSLNHHTQGPYRRGTATHGTTIAPWLSNRFASIFATPSPPGSRKGIVLLIIFTLDLLHLCKAFSFVRCSSRNSIICLQKVGHFSLRATMVQYGYTILCYTILWNSMASGHSHRRHLYGSSQGEMEQLALW